MASRILHLAVAEEMLKKVNLQDKNRFRLGCILPDAYNPKVSKADSHLKVFVCGNSKKTYDLRKFCTLYGDKMKSDELYMGYYMHLIQDLIFRKLVYGKYKWDPTVPGNVQKLHNDYRLINKYVLLKYGVTKDISLPENLSQEEIYEIYPFEPEALLADMKNDFMDNPEGDIFFFTREMADEFVENAVENCIKEYDAIKEDGLLMDAYDHAWINKEMLAFCGTYCGVCEWKDKIGCKGCKANRGVMFWGECDKAKCCMEKGFEHCGECPDMPCQKLRELFDDPEHGDHGARLRNLKNWKNGNYTYEKLGNAAQENAKNLRG